MEQTAEHAVSTAAEPDVGAMSDEQLDAALREAPAEPEVKEAPAAETAEADAKEAPEKKETMVPHGALHEERMKRRNAEQEARRIAAENQAMREQMARAQERLDQLFAQKQRQDAPDPNTQPLEALAHGQNVTAQELKAMRDRMEAQEQQRAQAQQFEQFRNATAQAEAQFREQNPDYDAAVGHVLDRRANEYRALGVTEDQIGAYLRREVAQVAANAMRNGRNPAEVAYELAHAMGFSRKPAAPSAAEKLEMQTKGQAAAKPSGSAGSSGKPTIQQLAAMSAEEFDAATSGKKWADIWK